MLWCLDVRFPDGRRRRAWFCEDGYLTRGEGPLVALVGWTVESVEDWAKEKRATVRRVKEPA